MTAHHLSQQAIRRYAELSGDFNPLHVDPDYAARTTFGGTIAHGPLALQPFFEELCDWLGLEALPVGTRLRAKFLAPVPSGSTVQSELSRTDDRTLRAVCRLESGVEAVETEVEMEMDLPSPAMETPWGGFRAHPPA